MKKMLSVAALAVFGWVAPAVADYEIRRGAECPDGGQPALVATVNDDRSEAVVITLPPAAKRLVISVFTTYDPADNMLDVVKAAMVTGNLIHIGYNTEDDDGASIAHERWVRVDWNDTRTCWALAGVMPLKPSGWIVPNAGN